MQHCKHGCGAAAVVCVIAVGLYIALKPKPKRQPETVAHAADEKDWIFTGRFDFADPQSVGALVLELEEIRIFMRPSGVEHREIRWRRATIPEAKMVLDFLPYANRILNTVHLNEIRHVGDPNIGRK